MKYRTIVADPPWPQRVLGAWQRRAKRPAGLPYDTMTVSAICALSVAELAEPDCHLWLWTTNSHIEDAFAVMRSWRFRYLAMVTWVKPSGPGAYFATTTQHCLFGYRERCVFAGRRWAKTHFHASARGGHSAKPEAFVDLVESVSQPPRLELFARTQRLGWDTWGNEALCHVDLGAAHP